LLGLGDAFEVVARGDEAAEYTAACLAAAKKYCAAISAARAKRGNTFTNRLGARSVAVSLSVGCIASATIVRPLLYLWG
jgi:hypothetical protein